MGLQYEYRYSYEYEKHICVLFVTLNKSETYKEKMCTRTTLWYLRRNITVTVIIRTVS